MRLPCFLPSVPYLSPSPARISGKSEPILSVAQRTDPPTTAGKYVHREGASDKARFRLAHDWPTTGRQLADDVAVLRGACYYNWHVTKVVRGLKNATKFLSIMSMVAIMSLRTCWNALFFQQDPAPQYFPSGITTVILHATLSFTLNSALSHPIHQPHVGDTVQSQDFGNCLVFGTVASLA